MTSVNAKAYLLTYLKPSSKLVRAKFHYTSWFGASSEPSSVMEFGREPASSC